jgi:hypothetical protein
MMSESTIWWGLLFGTLGIGYFVYGKRQRMVVALASGIALMVFPYFVSNAMLIVLIGALLLALPFLFRF